jgi:outer membrane protein OmpA-like peptidoglycan-associated protein
MMKRIILIFLLVCSVLRLSAQDSPAEKPSTLAFHVFYNDFNTAQLIRSTSLNNVFNNNLWSRIGDLQMGFGFNYLKGISRHIDFVSTIDGSSTNYLFKDGTYYGSNQFLLDINVGLNIKLLADQHVVVPYLSTGAGFSLYQGKTGFYIPVGWGIQFNLFNQALVFTNMQYRRALTAQVNDHFHYNIGIGVSIGKKKTVKPVAAPLVSPVKVTKPDTIAVVVKIPVKNVIVTVTDLQTGLPLPGVLVVLNSPGGNSTGVSDAGGNVNFNDVHTGDYTVSGTLDGINTTAQQIAKSSFDTPEGELKITITHNDPRFTLAGTVINKSARKPESGVTVSAVNTTQISTDTTQSKPDGTFNIQLKAASDFIVSGKKAGYISNIEQLSTTGLNRSTTLYVKLELGIEEASPDKTITLSNIYYDIGSTRIRPGASSDLEKLIKFLKDNPGIKIEIDSHTDSRGSTKRNLVLSQARAQEVVNYLQKNGISKNRLVPKGYGATRLVNGCKVGVKCTEAQHEQNRRTEFKVTGN